MNFLEFILNNSGLGAGIAAAILAAIYAFLIKVDHDCNSDSAARGAALLGFLLMVVLSVMLWTPNRIQGELLPVISFSLWSTAFAALALGAFFATNPWIRRGLFISLTLCAPVLLGGIHIVVANGLSASFLIAAWCLPALAVARMILKWHHAKPTPTASRQPVPVTVGSSGRARWQRTY